VRTMRCSIFVVGIFTLIAGILTAESITPIDAVQTQESTNTPVVVPEDSSSPIVDKDPNIQAYSRNLGSQLFEIDLGAGIPLFSHPDQNGGITWGSHLNLGGTASLKWSAFLDPNVALGLDISGLFSSGPNGNAFSMFPIGVRVSDFLKIPNAPIQVPLNLTLAVNIMRYRDLSYVGFAAKAGFSVFWDATRDWSFGLNVLWWWAPEIYTNQSGTPPASQTRHAHFLEISLSALYNF